MTVYGRAGDVMRFYEINPAVRQLAEQHFTYLRYATARVEIVLGDARLSLEREPPQHFDLLVLDAFNGDAIPTHLLTKECFETYLRHLQPEGVMAVHISNQHLDLVPVLRNVAGAFGLGLASIPIEKPRTTSPWILPTHWCLLTRNEAFLRHPSIQVAARRTRDDAKRVPLWTDDYVSLLPILK